MNWARSFGEAVVRYRILCLGLATVLTVASSFLAVKVTFDSDIEGWFLENDPSLVVYHEFLERFEGDEYVLLVVEGEDVFSPEILRSVDSLTRAAGGLDSIHRVRSLTNIKVPLVVEDDMRVDKLIPILPETEDEARAVREKALANTLVRNFLVSGDGRASAVAFELKGRDLDFDKKVEVVSAIEELGNKQEWGDARILLAGGPVLDRAFFEYSKRDFSLMGPLAFLMVIGILFLLFRNIVMTLVPIAVVTLTLIWTFGLMGLLGLQVTMVSTSLVTLCIAVGVADSVHLLTEFRQQIRRQGHEAKRAAVESIAYLTLPCFFTSLTTGVGFLALLAGDLAPIGEFGWLAAVAVFLAFVLTVTILPAFLSFLPTKGRAEQHGAVKSSTMEQFLGWMHRLSMTRTRGVLAFSLGLGILAAFSLSTIRAESNPIHYFKSTDPVRMDMVETDELLGGTATLEFVVRTEPGGLKEPEVLSKIAQLQSGVSAVEGIGEIQSPLELIEEAHRVFVDGTGIPETTEMIAQLFLILEGEPEDFEAMVQGDYDIGRVSARTQLAVDAPLKDRKKQLDEVVKSLHDPDEFDLQMTGFVQLMTDVELYLFEGQVRSFLLALFVIATILFFLLGSLSLGLLSLIPNLTPIAFGLAFMGIAGINLDPGTVMIGPIALGLVVDDCVHFLFRYRGLVRAGKSVEEACLETIHSSGRAIVTTSLVLSGGFAILAIGSFIPNIYFGVVTAFVVLVAMVADLVTLPAALQFFMGGERQVVGEEF